jgi:uncharacterized repeat protein (TIGR02543 family)
MKKIDITKFMHKIISFVLAFFMVIALLPAGEIFTTVKAAASSITIGTESVTDLNANQEGTGWTWEASTKNLKLSGVNLTSSVTVSNIDINIILEGVNQISSGTSSALVGDASTLTISGSGILDATSSATAGTVVVSNTNKLVLKSGYVTVTDLDKTTAAGPAISAIIDVSGGYLNALTKDSTGMVTPTGSAIVGDTLTITGGSVLADSVKAYSIKGNVNISAGYLEATCIDGSVTNSNGVVKSMGVSSGYNRYGVTGDVTTTGGVMVLQGDAYNSTAAVKGVVKDTTATPVESYWTSIKPAAGTAGTSLTNAGATLTSNVLVLAKGIEVSATLNNVTTMDGMFVTGGTTWESGSNSATDWTVTGGNLFYQNNNNIFLPTGKTFTNNGTLVFCAGSASGGTINGTATGNEIINNGTIVANGDSAGFRISSFENNGNFIDDALSTQGEFYPLSVYSGSLTQNSGDMIVINHCIGNNSNNYNTCRAIMLRSGTMNIAAGYVTAQTYYGTAVQAPEITQQAGAAMTFHSKNKDGVNRNPMTGVNTINLPKDKVVYGSSNSYGPLQMLKLVNGTYYSEYTNYAHTVAYVVFLSGPGPTCTIGDQTGSVTTGTGGSSTYSVSHAYFTNNSTITSAKNYTIGWCDSDGNDLTTAPDGLTLAITSDSLLTVTSTDAVLPGDYYFKLTIKDSSIVPIETAYGIGKFTVDKKLATDSMKTASGSVSIDGVTGGYVTLPELPDGAVCGTPTSKGDIALTNMRVTGQILSYDAGESTQGSVSTITIPVTNATLYKDYEIVVTLKSIGKSSVVISGITTNGKEYDGEAASSSGTAVFTKKKDNSTVSVSSTLIYQYYLSDQVTMTTSRNSGASEDGGAPVIPGTYSLLISIPDTDENYMGSIKLPFTITKRSVSITGLSVADKTYDGTLDATVQGTAALDRLVSGDTVTITAGTAAFLNKNAGTETASFTGYSLGGADADKYTLTGQPADVTATINQRPVTVSGITAVSRSYAANDISVTLNYDAVTFSNETVVTGDTLTVTATGAFDSASVGTDKTVTITGITLGGTDVGNYTLASTGQQTKTLASILPLSRTIDAPTVTEIHPTTATLNVPSYSAGSGTIEYAKSTYNYVPSNNWQTSNVFNNLTESTNYYFFARIVNDTDNIYSDATSTGTLGTTPEKTTVSITGLNAPTATYNGTQIASSVFGTPVVSNDSVPVADLIYTYYLSDGTTMTTATNSRSLTEGGAPRDAGTYLLIVSVPSSNGNYKGNTQIIFTIAKKSTTITGLTANNKTYDKTTSASTTGGTLSDIYTGDTVGISNGTAAFASVDVGTGIAVTFTGYSLNGANAGNYTLTAQPADSSADITAKEIKISGITASNKVYDSTTAATLDYTNTVFSGIVEGDSLGVTATGTFTDKNVGTGKTVNITGLSLTGNTNNDYVLAASGQQTSTTANITVATLTVSANANQTKKYGQKDPVYTYTVESGWQGSDASANLITGSLARASGESVSTYALNIGSLSAGSNYTISFTSADFTITPSDVTLTVSTDKASAKPGKSITVTVNAVNASSDLEENGWSQPVVSLKAPDDSVITLTADSTVSGRYTGTYVIPKGTAAATSLSFTASMTDTTGNYNKPADQSATITVLAMSESTLTVTASKTSDVTYGDSVTYTAAITSTNDTINKLGGTISFYLGSVSPANLLATKTIGTDALTVTLDYKKLTAGQHTITVAYSGDAEYGETSASCNTTVNQKELTWDTTGLSSTKTYDRTTAATITGTLSVSGKVGDDVIGFTYDSSKTTAAYANADAGENKTIQVTVSTGVITNANYKLPSSSPEYTGTITQAVIDTASLSTTTYNYNKNKITPTINEVKSGTLTLSDTEYTLTGDISKTDAGSYKITVTGTGNFTGTKDLPWSISPINGSITVSLNGWVYGSTAGTPSAQITDGNYTNPVYEYKLASETDSAYSQTVPVDAGNYVIRLSYAATTDYHAASATGTFTIAPKALTPSITGTVTKTYDSSTTASGLTISLDGIVNNDDVSATATSYTYNTKDVATADTITANTVTLSGTRASNYTCVTSVTALGTITSKEVTVSGITAADKTYDGNTTASVNTVNASFDGLVTGDALGVTAVGTFDTANAGTGKTVTLSALALTGNDLHDYVLASDGNQSSTTADIEKAVLTITADTKTKTYGQNDPALTYQDSGWKGTDTMQLLTGNLARVSGESAGEYTINQGTLNTTDNYTIAYTSAKLVIGPSDILFSISVDPSSAKQGKTVTVTVTAKNNSSDLEETGWNQPNGVTLTAPDGSLITLKPVSGSSGEYTGTYKIPSGTAADTALQLSAAVLDTTDNYTNPDSSQNATETVAPMSVSSLTVTPSKTADVTYGDSVTYTVNVNSDNDTEHVPSGTVKFYLGDAATGELLSTQTVGSDTLTYTLDYTKLTAGDHTVTVVYSGDDEFDGSVQAYTTTIAPKVLTWDTSELKSDKNFDGTLDAPLTGDLKVSGMVGSDDVKFTYDKENTVGKFADSNAGEDKLVTVTVSDAAIDNSNYVLPPLTTPPTFTATITAVQEIAVPKEQEPHGYRLKLEKSSGITYVAPEITAADPSLNSPAAIMTKLKSEVDRIIGATEDPETEYFDLILWVSKDNGVTWEKATKDNFPAEGITVVIPYDQLNTTYEEAKNMKFSVVHMFATTANGHTPGTLETPSWQITEDGLQFVVQGLSPMTIESTKKIQVTINLNGGTGSADTVYADLTDKVSGLTVPTREGYTFAGWYTAEEGGEEVTDSTVLSGDTTLYAHWKKNAVNEVLTSADTSDKTSIWMWAGLETVSLITAAIISKFYRRKYSD